MVEVLAGRPQVQVEVVVLARPGRFSTTAPSAPAVVVCPTRHSFFAGPVFLLGRAHSPDLCPCWELFLHGFCMA